MNPSRPSRPTRAIHASWARAQLGQVGLNPRAATSGEWVTFHPENAPGIAQVLDRRTVELTGPLQRWTNRRSGPFALARSLNAGVRSLPCLASLPCSWQNWCCTGQYTWQEPQIAFTSQFAEISDLYLDFAANHLRGIVTIDFDNKSIEGEEIRQRRCKCTGGVVGTQVRTVDGSATLNTSGSNNVVATQVGKGLGYAREAFTGVPPRRSVTGSAGFESELPDEVLQALNDYAKDGSLQIKKDLHLVVSYQWQGKTQTRSYQVTVDQRLPVRTVHWKF